MTPYKIIKIHNTRIPIPNINSILQIIDASLGAFLLNMYIGNIITVPTAKISIGYKNPLQKDSCQIKSFEIPLITQISNNIPQEINTPYLLRDFLKL